MSTDYSKYLDRLQQRKTELGEAELVKPEITKAERLVHALAPIQELAQSLHEAGEIGQFSATSGDAREAKCTLDGPNRKWSITVCCRDAGAPTKQQLDMSDELFSLEAKPSPDYLIAVRGTVGVERRFEYDGQNWDYGPVFDYIIECVARASKR